MTASQPAGAPRRRAALRGLAAAANRAATAMLDSLILERGFRRQATPGPHMTRCITLIGDLNRTGQLTGCRHLVGGGARAAYWLHWAPSGILCGACLKTACDVHADPDGAVCDRCRLSVPLERFTINVFLRPGEVDDEREPFIVVPPLLLWVGLCRACQVVEDAGES